MFFLRQPADVEVLNDVNGEVINLYRVVKNHLEEFMRQFKSALASRQLFEWAKETPPEVLTDIQRAARYLYIQKLSFGGKVTGQTFGYSPSSPPRFNILRLEEDLSQAHLRLSRVWIEHLDWATCTQLVGQVRVKTGGNWSLKIGKKRGAFKVGFNPLCAPSCG